MTSDDLMTLRDTLRDFAHAGYKIDVDDKEVLRVWFQALRQHTLVDVREAVDRLLVDHDMATVKPRDINNAIRDIRRARHRSDYEQADNAEPETLEESLRRRQLPWTVNQYEAHQSRISSAMKLRLRGVSEDAILQWLRKCTDVDEDGTNQRSVDVPDELLAAEEKTVSAWFQSYATNVEE